MTDDPKTERVIFVQFSEPPPRTLRPHEIVTLATYDHPVHPWTSRHTYDCEVQKDGTLLYDMSGSGTEDDPIYIWDGPWWAAKGIKVEPSNAHVTVGKRIRRLPERWRPWPPDPLRSMEGPMAYCDTCGWLPNEGGPAEDPEEYADPHPEQPPCEHLTWDGVEWVQRGAMPCGLDDTGGARQPGEPRGAMR